MNISIIIPYYKTFDMTEELLSRLKKQKKDKSIEIILIDDSGDGEKLSQYVDTYIKNIKNLGVAGSRNLGISQARGNYITFIDCDDNISPDYIKTLLELADQNNDLSWISWTSKYGDAIVDSTKQINIAPWGCLFKRNIFDTITFNDKLNVGEEPEFWDAVFSLRELKIGFSPKIIYYYNIRENSLTRRYDKGEVPRERKEEN